MDETLAHTQLMDVSQGADGGRDGQDVWRGFAPEPVRADARSAEDEMVGGIRGMVMGELVYLSSPYSALLSG